MQPALDLSHDDLVQRLADDVLGLTDVLSAAALVLDELRRLTGLGTWLMTRLGGDDHVALAVSGSAYPICVGDAMPWSESICARMVHGLGPRFAPDLTAVPAYAEAPACRWMPIGSYLGVPLVSPDGELLGTLCAIDPHPAGPELSRLQPLVELHGRLLAGLLSQELAAVRAARAHDLADPTAGLPGSAVLGLEDWAALLTREDSRCAQHASPACVLTVRTQESDAAVQPLLEAQRRAGDVLARTGPGEWAILCPDTPVAVGHRLATDLHARLQEAGAPAAFGVAGLVPMRGDLCSTWRTARLACREEQDLLV